MNGGSEAEGLPGQHESGLRAGDPHQVGPYRLLRRLGEGGMGTVYLGEAPDGARVAVKLLHHTIAADPGFRRRFRREVEAAKRVARFCTAAVIDAQMDGETAYLVTEYVPGPTLREAVVRDGPLRGSSLEGLAVSIATALRAIHAAGIIHRDLKPGNVLLSPVGPKVIDFGVAHLTDMTGHMSSAVVGTPSFMSPEQFEGGPLTPASDVFAWASTIAYAGTGRAPFGNGSLPVVLNRVINGEPDLTGLDGPLGTLVARALAKNPAERPTVQDILDTLIGSAAPATMPGGGGRPSHRLAMGIGAGAVALAAAVAAVWLGTSPGSSSSGPSATSVAAALPSESPAHPTASPAHPSASAADTGGNPLREPGVRFAYRQEPDPQRQAETWEAQGRKADAALMRALAAVPHSVNLNMPLPEVKDTVTSTMRLAAAHDATPVFMTDYIPLTDCSRRGAPDERTYRHWIDQVATGIGAGRAVVVLEPNSLTKVPGTDGCDEGGAAGTAERYRELGYAVERLGKLPHTAVYLDGGIQGWPESVTIMADRLVKASVGRADGFYLNSSDFQHTDTLLPYGERLSRCVHVVSAKGGGTCTDAEIAAVPADAPLTHFVIDTSRNGKGVWDGPEGKYADPQLWCNPPGRGVGPRPTTDTGSELADAFLWIRHPGESNGRCLRGGSGPEDPVYHQVAPVGGTWWAALALDRARNAVPPLR